jgi:predicted alpha/beta-hydrolase family hydrolase
MVESISITVSETVRVSGLLQNPPHARACYVMAHGAGAGMNHPFMAAIAAGLALRGIASLRFQFPYMERGTKGPTRRNWRKQLCAVPCLQRWFWFPNVHSLAVGNRLAAG